MWAGGVVGAGKFFPAGSTIWPAERIGDELATARDKSHGYSVPIGQLEVWRNDYLAEMGKTEITVDLASGRVIQTRVIPLLLVDDGHLKGLAALRCALSASRLEGGVHVLFSVIDSIGARASVVNEIANGFYNSGIEHVGPFISLLELLVVSDPHCTITTEFGSSGSNINARYADALQQGVLGEGE